MKLGLLVEGDTDRAALEGIVHRLLPRVTVYSVRVGGKASLTGAYVTVAKFFEAGYEHAFILFDTDGESEERIDQTVERVKTTLREHGLLDFTTVCPVDPDLEGWMLDGLPQSCEMRTLFEHSHNGLEFKRKSPALYKKAAAEIDFDALERRNASFASFKAALMNVVNGTVTVRT